MNLAMEIRNRKKIHPTVLRNRGYYLSFSKDLRDGLDTVPIEELRIMYSRQTQEIAELKQHNRALSHTLWEVSRNPGKDNWLEERLSHQAVEIDKLQNANAALTVKFERQKVKLNSVQLALKHAKEEKDRLVQVSKLNGQLTDLEAAVNQAKQEVAYQVKLLENASIKVEAIKTSMAVADKLFEERTEAISLLKQIKSTGMKKLPRPALVEKVAQTEKQATVETRPTKINEKPTALEEAQAEIANLHEAVRSYFFQFAGSTTNGGAELDWLVNRAEKLSQFHALPVNSEPLAVRPYSKSMQL